MTTTKRALMLGAAVAGWSAAPACAQTADDWTSFYVGGQATGSSDSVDAGTTLTIDQISNLYVTGRGIVVVPANSRPYAASDRTTGVIGGGFAGYQRQLDRVVIGIEGDFTPLRRTASAAESFVLPPTAISPATMVAARRDVRLDDRWSARARLGYAARETLIYVTGGYARTRARVTSVDSFTNPGGPAATGVCGPANTPCVANFGPEGPVVTTAVTQGRPLSGWTAGAGLERKLGRSLSIGIEYRRTDMTGRTFTPTSSTTVNTGPVTMGDAGGLGGSGFGVTGLPGMVEPGPTRVKVKSDALNLRLALHF